MPSRNVDYWHQDHYVEKDCLRERYEFYQKQRTYCSVPDMKCLYRRDNPDKEGQYQCMRLEKMIR